MSNLVNVLMVLMMSSLAVYAFPGGAPRTACGSMSPIHMLFSAKEASEAPFVLVVDTNQVKSLKSSDVGKVAAAPSVIVTIKTTSEKEFKGFLLQAHNGKGAAVGSFTIPDDTEGKTLDCGEGSANAVTHNSRSKKTNESFLWTPPLDFQGQVTFTATLVEGFRTFYTDVKAIPVTVSV